MGTFDCNSKAIVLTSQGYGDLCADRTLVNAGWYMNIGLFCSKVINGCTHEKVKIPENPMETFIVGAA